MIYVFAVLIIFVLIFPTLWIKYTIWKYSKPDNSIPGSGKELVIHLATRFNIDDLSIEKSNPGEDHYSPLERTIRLSPKFYEGHSVAAVAIATHEFSHALQYHNQEQITQLREKYTPIAIVIEKISIALVGIIPILVMIFKAPQIGIISLIAAIASLTVSVLLQLIILPMEWDASFNKALPILIEGKYLKDGDIPKAKKLLRAAALTYLASTLVSLLNVWRWLRILKR